MQAGNGTGDRLNAGGGTDKLIAGNGGGQSLCRIGRRHGRRWKRRRHLLDRRTRGSFAACGRYHPARGNRGDTLYVSAFVTDISPITISGIQTLEMGTSVTLTAAQFAEFSSIKTGSRCLGFHLCGHGGHLQPRRQDVRSFDLIAKIQRGHDADPQRCRRRNFERERIGLRHLASGRRRRATASMRGAAPTR